MSTTTEAGTPPTPPSRHKQEPSARQAAIKPRVIGGAALIILLVAGWALVAPESSSEILGTEEYRLRVGADQPD